MKCEPLYQPGDWIASRYEIRKVLDYGPHRYLYLAYRHDERGLVVLKTIADERQTSRTDAACFYKEMESWIDVDRHPNILEARWVDTESGRLFIEADYCRPDKHGRTTLADYLKLADQYPLCLAQILEWSIHCCLGMEHLNACGFVAHRDLNPTNLLIREDDVLQIADFGLAVRVPPETARRRKSIHRILTGLHDSPDFRRSLEGVDGLEISGTMGYIAPEVLDGEAVTVQSDIFSMGVVLWQMATRRAELPFGQMARTNASVPMVEVLRRQLEVLLSGPPTQSHLDPVIARSLAMNPRDRFSDFGQMRAVLEAIYQTETGRQFVPPRLQEMTPEDWKRRGICLSNLGRNRESMACYEQAVAVDPKCVTAWVNKASLHGTFGEKDKEMECYEIAMDLQSDFAIAWNNKGLALKESPEQAIDCFNKAISSRSDYVSPWAHKGHTLRFLGREEEAVECYDKAVALNPRDIRAVEGKAELMYGRQLWQKALDGYDHVLLVRPDHDTAYHWKAECFKALRQFDLSAHCCAKQAAISRRFRASLHFRIKELSNLNGNPISTEYHRLSESDAEQYIALSESQIKAKQYASAVITLERAIIIDPRLPEAWIRKSECFQCMKDKQQALVCARLALLVARSSANAWFQHAVCLYDMAAYEESLASSIRAIELRPQWEACWYCRARSEDALQRYEDAIESYRRFLALSPAHNKTEIAEARQRINELQLRCSAPYEPQFSTETDTRPATR